MLPPALTLLRLGSFYNQPLALGALPPSLTTLSFHHGIFNRQLHAGVLPASLDFLDLGDGYNPPLSQGVLPASLRTLRVGRRFKQMRVLPASLQAMQVGGVCILPHRFVEHAIDGCVTVLRTGRISKKRKL